LIAQFSTGDQLPHDHAKPEHHSPAFIFMVEDATTLGNARC
jgi:hypothetical protein